MQSLLLRSGEAALSSWPAPAHLLRAAAALPSAATTRTTAAAPARSATLPSPSSRRLPASCSSSLVRSAAFPSSTVVAAFAPQAGSPSAAARAAAAGAGARALRHVTVPSSPTAASFPGPCIAFCRLFTSSGRFPPACRLPVTHACRPQQQVEQLRQQQQQPQQQQQLENDSAWDTSSTVSRSATTYGPADTFALRPQPRFFPSFHGRALLPCSGISGSYSSRLPCSNSCIPCNRSRSSHRCVLEATLWKTQQTNGGPSLSTQRRYLGNEVTGPQFDLFNPRSIDLKTEAHFAGRLFCGSPTLSYWEFQQNCVSLRVFLFLGILLLGAADFLVFRPVSSAYWSLRWSPLRWPRSLQQLFFPPKGDIFAYAAAGERAAADGSCIHTEACAAFLSLVYGCHFPPPTPAALARPAAAASDKKQAAAAVPTAAKGSR